MSKKDTSKVVNLKPDNDTGDAVDQFESQTSMIPIDNRVGGFVRNKRQERGLTLADLTLGTNLSAGMLSRIENGQSSASLDVLERICGALGISLANLMVEIDTSQGSAQLIKKDDQLEVVRTGTRFGHNYKLLSYQRGPKQPFEPFLIEMDRESEEYPTFRHPGVEFLYMLEGRMNYKFGDKLYLLEPGDAFTFSGEVEHGPGELMTDKVKFMSTIYHDL